MVNKKEKKKEMSFMTILGGKIEFEIFPEEILDREVKAYGNSGHVIVPKKHIGKRAQVTIIRKETTGNKIMKLTKNMSNVKIKQKEVDKG